MEQYNEECENCGEDMWGHECYCCGGCDDCCECETETLDNGVQITTGKAMNGLQAINISSKDSGIDLRDLFYS